MDNPVIGSKTEGRSKSSQEEEANTYGCPFMYNKGYLILVAKSTKTNKSREAGTVITVRVCFGTSAITVCARLDFGRA